MRRNDIHARSQRTIPLALLAALLLAACGPSPSINVQLGDATIQIVVGGSASTEVALTRMGGAAAEVTLDASGVPSWAAVAFDPPTLSGDTLSSMMTISTDGDHPAAEATSFTLTVTAVGTGLTSSDEVTVQTELLTVTGRVVNAVGEAMTGASVAVEGDAPIVVDANGEFEGPDVAIPYDLVVFDAVAGWAHVYQGLTTTDVTLMSIEDFGVTANSTTVSGDLSAPVGANQVGVVCVEGVDLAIIGGCTQVDPGNTAYSVGVDWSGAATTPARVRAWVVDVDGDDVTTGFASEGQTAVNISDGVAALVDVALGAGPDATTVDVTITPPVGLPLGGSAVVYNYGPYGGAAFPGPVPSDMYSVVLPDVPGTTAALIALAQNTDSQVYGWTVGDPGTGELSLVMPDPLTYLAPADATTGVDTSTLFRVNNPSGSANTFVFSNIGTSILVSSNSNQITIPDLSGYGFGLPAATSFDWQVIVTPQLGTVDDLVAEGWVADLIQLQYMLSGGGSLTEDGGLSAVSGRGFTTE